MNILFIKYFFVGFMVSDIPRVSVWFSELLLCGKQQSLNKQVSRNDAINTLIQVL